MESGFKDCVFRDIDLASLFEGTPGRRYSLVNKALKAKELIRIVRGYYIVGPKYQSARVNRFYIANQIVPYSFISAESALSFHGWIPERVEQITSLSVFGRSRRFATPFGDFLYLIPPVKLENFLKGVQVIHIENKSVWMATPLRALLDYIFWHKIDNANVEFLKNSLRIETEVIETITRNDIKELMQVYNSKRVKTFLENLLGELKNNG